MQSGIINKLLLYVLEEYPGHDISSVSMIMTIILLGLYQNIQDIARDELYNIFGDSDRDAAMEDLNAMIYLDAVIKESLRLYPVVSPISREIQTTLKLRTIIPPRFLDEENKEKCLFNYLPFSAGPRNCIGKININKKFYFSIPILCTNKSYYLF
ncbi:Cytochrome P450,Cytochrome P450, conserved site [Cinara cedri]|uniref:Cytochrome P450,Cytochrome P450, conserved site n=1 Tax=Cinara cedri TaxID=506608 RepID=A0A5E4NEY3_9HEMI|nr:Cytochrome P450,Cytochrome P450, conserved site [Cinara cedri]